MGSRKVLPLSEEVCMYREKYRVQYYPRFQASTEGVEIYTLRIKGRTVVRILPLWPQEAVCLDSGVSSPRFSLMFSFRPHFLPH